MPSQLSRSLSLSVVILLADGVRPDTLDAALQRGALPALARLRDEGEFRVVTSCFPSVTGPAYAPFLMGRFPGPVGLPGLRWFDRARTACRFPDYTRSYVGYQMSAVDRDLDPDAPTIFELCDESLAALSVISRGLDKDRRIGAITARSAFRAATTHFSGNVAGWLDIDREVARQVVERVRTDRPAFTFAALTGVDKVSHSRGHASPMVLDALRIVDGTAARIRDDAERDGRWHDMSLWVVSDHGHSRVLHHEDLAALIEDAGMRTMSHPWVYNIAPEVAVMVSGNAMAHLYLDVPARSRTAGHDGRFRSLVELLLARASVDLLITPTGDEAVVYARGRGSATVAQSDRGYQYRRQSGDPLGIGRDVANASMNEAYEATTESDYPDGIVQIVHLATAPRSGEIILSAARDWDFRARYEPIPHISSHGALHREHMLVPLLVNHRVKREPRRTVDVMPSALVALGLPVPDGLDGESFL